MVAATDLLDETGCDAENFGEALTPELREQEQRLRAQARK